MSDSKVRYYSTKNTKVASRDDYDTSNLEPGYSYWISDNGDIDLWTGTQWVSAGTGGAASVKIDSIQSGDDLLNNVKVVEQGQFSYETVAVSQTDQVLGLTGSDGDFIHRLVCVVATAATSSVSIKDGAGSAISVLPANVGGGVGTYTIELNMSSAAGAWSVTTGAGVTALAVGRFSA